MSKARSLRTKKRVYVRICDFGSGNNAGAVVILGVLSTMIVPRRIVPVMGGCIELMIPYRRSPRFAADCNGCCCKTPYGCCQKESYHTCCLSLLLLKLSIRGFHRGSEMPHGNTSINAIEENILSLYYRLKFMTDFFLARRSLSIRSSRRQIPSNHKLPNLESFRCNHLNRISGSRGARAFIPRGLMY